MNNFLERLLGKNRKEHKLIDVAVVMITISFILLNYVSFNSLNKEQKENDEAKAHLIAARVHDAINSELTKPIMIGIGMANNSFLLDSLHAEGSRTEAENVEIMQRHLFAIKERMDYDSVFIVSEGSKRYYTFKGLNKYIDVINDKHDIWYKIFAESGKKYDLDVDLDEVDSKKWTVFMNTRIDDANGHFLGVCGVGVRMTRLQELFAQYEKEYGVKINMVNHEGLVQIDTNTLRIENAYLIAAEKGRRDSEKYIYTVVGYNGYVISKYVENLDWYLVIQKPSSNLIASISDIIITNAVLYIIILLILVLYVSFVLKHETQKIMSEVMTDTVTGLGNRNYYKNMIGGDDTELIDGKYSSIAVFDIDNFKKVNDTFGHQEGDKILRTVAILSQEIIGDNGIVLRWGGDEFVIIFTAPFEKAQELCEELRKNVQRDTSVTVSVGVASVHIGQTFKNAFYRADQAMYFSKEHGRNMVEIYDSWESAHNEEP